MRSYLRLKIKAPHRSKIKFMLEEKALKSDFLNAELI